MSIGAATAALSSNFRLQLVLSHSIHLVSIVRVQIPKPSFASLLLPDVAEIPEPVVDPVAAVAAVEIAALVIKQQSDPS
jgi:hypothetical protein